MSKREDVPDEVLVHRLKLIEGMRDPTGAADRLEAPRRFAAIAELGLIALKVFPHVDPAGNAQRELETVRAIFEKVVAETERECAAGPSPGLKARVGASLHERGFDKSVAARAAWGLKPGTGCRGQVVSIDKELARRAQLGLVPMTAADEAMVLAEAFEMAGSDSSDQEFVERCENASAVLLGQAFGTGPGSEVG